MRTSFWRPIAFRLCLLGLLGLAIAPRAAADGVSFTKTIRPILTRHCQGCHQPARASGSYVVTSVEALHTPGESGERPIVAGQPELSHLFAQIVASPPGDAPAMPKGKPALSDAETAAIRAWIAAGAVDDSPVVQAVRFDADHPPTYAARPVITSLAIDPAGRWLAVPGFHEIVLVPIEKGGERIRLVGAAERLTSVIFSPDGKRLAAVGGAPAAAGAVQVWDLATKQLVVAREITFDTLFGASYSPDGKRIACGAVDRAVRAIDAETGDTLLHQGGHDDWVFGTAWSRDGSHLASVSRDRTLKLTEFATQRLVDNITSVNPGRLTGGLLAIDRHPTRDELAIGGSDGRVQIFRMFREGVRQIEDDANKLREFPPLPGRVTSVRFDPTGRLVLASSSADGRGHAWILDAESGEVVAQTPPVAGGLYAVAWHPRDAWFAAAGFEGVVRCYRATDASLLRTVEAFTLATADAKADTPTESPASPVDPASITPVPRESETASGDPVPRAPALPIEDIVAIACQPASLEFSAACREQQLVITATTQGGMAFDVTRQVTVSAAPPLVAISSTGRARGLAAGQGQLSIAIGKATLRVPFRVTPADPDRPISFVREVMPLFARRGCNQGLCHGNQHGQNGFKLSLRGYDAAADHTAISEEIAGRRWQRASIDQSLILAKPSGAIPHQGGVLFTSEDDDYRLLRRWLTQGAAFDRTTQRVQRLEIFPRDATAAAAGTRQQFAVHAHYADGSSRDVTSEANLESSQRDVASIDMHGLATALRAGETAILARYEGAYVATNFAVLAAREGFIWNDPKQWNAIDALVDAKLRRLEIVPSSLASDAEFIRRIYLDLTGLPPPVDVVLAFLADASPTQAKRAQLVDRLLASPEFIDHWTAKWCDLLQVNRRYLGLEGAARLREWIRQAIADDLPYDAFARQLLGGSGSSLDDPAAAYFQIHAEPGEAAENATHLFLGIRFNCNKCHDHPFERWTQGEYYELAAYLARVGRKPLGPASTDPAAEPGPIFVFDRDQGEIEHRRTGETTPPRFPFTHAGMPSTALPRRAQFVAWMASPDNPYFATSYVNRVWSYLLGAGIIEPIDDLRAGNPPSNPALLAHLTAHFKTHGFRVRSLIREICTSRVYNQSIATNRWNVGDARNFSHALPRRLTAETLVDTIAVGLDVKIPISGVPIGTRAEQLPDPSFTMPGQFLELFGRPPRESPCECERESGMSLRQALALVNGPVISAALKSTTNRLAKLVKREPDDAQVVAEIYLALLSRPPTERDLEIGLEAIRGGENRLQGAQDLAWGIINSAGFLFNR